MDDFIELDGESQKHLRALIAFRNTRTDSILRACYYRAALRVTDMLSQGLSTHERKDLYRLAALFEDSSTLYILLSLQDGSIRLKTLQIENAKSNLNLGR